MSVYATPVMLISVTKWNTQNGSVLVNKRAQSRHRNANVRAVTETPDELLAEPT